MNNNEQKFICEKCGKEFKDQWNLNRHIIKKNECIEDIKCDIFCHKCGKNFSRKDNLERHLNKKIPCVLTDEKNTPNKLSILEPPETITITKEKYNKLIESLLNNTNTSDSYNTQNITTNNINNTNTNSNNNTQNNITQGMNNTCLINYVVQQYPNAKNIEDCIKIENIPRATLTECEDLYFTDGAMKIFKGLCDLGEEHRPIHCTDASRCNYIYKSNDVWKIDVGGEAIRNHFFPVIQEAYTQVHKNRIKNNPGNSTIIGNYLTEMTGSNVKKICQKTLKRLSNDFLAKNSKNSKLIELQKIKKFIC
jgi:hypothetical protein